MEVLDRDSMSMVLAAAVAEDKYTLGAARVVCTTWRELLHEPKLLKGVVLGIGNQSIKRTARLSLSRAPSFCCSTRTHWHRGRARPLGCARARLAA